jgi:DNA-binding protein YbaB
MEAFGGSPDDGLVKDLVSSLARQNAPLYATQSRMKKLRGTGRSAGDRVRVEVDRFGVLVGLTIDPRAMRLGSQALSEAILEAVEEGVLDAKAQADAMMRPLVEELTDTTRSDPGYAEFAGWEPKDVLAALRDVRRDL